VKKILANLRMNLKLAWRNTFRNKRRTAIAATAVGIGLAALVFVDALLIGMERNMVRTATATFMGDGQIHAEGYRTTRDAADTIHRVDEVTRRLAADPRVRGFAPRVMSLGMLRSAANLNSAMLVGVDPRAEARLSKIDEAIIHGNFFSGDGSQQLVIGAKLAELLEVEVGDRVVATLSEAGTGELVQELFRVSGIYRFNADDLDRGMAVVRIDKARQMLALPANAAHEIAVSTAFDSVYPTPQSEAMWADYSTQGNEAAGWGELMPQLRAVFEYSQLSLLIVGLILFALVSLGVINALFMSIYERMFEFGVLRAVGTTPFQVWQMVVAEAGALAVVSIAVGVVLGLAAGVLLSYVGIDYRGIEMVGMTIQEKIYPVLELRQFIVYSFWVFVLTVVVGIYPAVTAARISPAESLRKSL
jgi:ABC-type lipoprotein release transport system permease subunit